MSKNTMLNYLFFTEMGIGAGVAAMGIQHGDMPMTVMGAVIVLIHYIEFRLKNDK